jgi:hypothetical protein
VLVPYIHLPMIVVRQIYKLSNRDNIYMVDILAQ